MGGFVLQKRCLAQTGMKVSQVGLGTVKLGRNEGVKYPQSFTLPSDQEALHLLKTAKDLGINLLDTAPAYGSSEARLGSLLQAERHDWIISTKVGEAFEQGKSEFDFSSQAMQQSIERSLKRLKTDYLDIVLVHSNGDDEDLINHQGVFDTLAMLKKSGKIRSFGMSCKTIAGGLLTIELADVAMITYHAAYTDERPVIAQAFSKQKAIFIKKALASGHLSQLGSKQTVASNLQFILAEPGVTSVIIGTINPEHLKENVSAIDLG